VLQEQEFERVGGSSPIRVDVRIIATTNRKLQADAANGTFRQDLYYRLSTIPIMIAPLRDRPEDIPLLAYRFVMRTAADIKKDVKGITPAALAMLQRYPWPGNVRELQHAVERAVILSNEVMLSPDAFDAARYGLDVASSVMSPPPRAGTPSVRSSHPGTMSASAGDGVWLETLNVNEAETALIQRALEAAGNNRTRAAELLGISVRTLRNKLNGPGRTGDHDAVEDELET